MWSFQSNMIPSNQHNYLKSIQSSAQIQVLSKPTWFLLSSTNPSNQHDYSTQVSNATQVWSPQASAISQDKPNLLNKHNLSKNTCSFKPHIITPTYIVSGLLRRPACKFLIRMFFLVVESYVSTSYDCSPTEHMRPSRLTDWLVCSYLRRDCAISIRAPFRLCTSMMQFFQNSTQNVETVGLDCALLTHWLYPSVRRYSRTQTRTWTLLKMSLDFPTHWKDPVYQISPHTGKHHDLEQRLANRLWVSHISLGPVGDKRFSFVGGLFEFLHGTKVWRRRHRYATGSSSTSGPPPFNPDLRFGILC